jgi:hypothetical protein
LLILGGISGAGMTTAIEKYRPGLLVLTFALLGCAFYVTYRPIGGGSRGSNLPGNSTRSRMMTFNKVTLWAATLMAIVFLIFPGSISGLFDPGDGFTADMDRTTLTVEGMT